MYFALAIRYCIALFLYLHDNTIARLVAMLVTIILLPIVIGINTFPKKKVGDIS
jgi:hypothetical protein